MVGNDTKKLFSSLCLYWFAHFLQRKTKSEALYPTKIFPSDPCPAVCPASAYSVPWCQYILPLSGIAIALKFPHSFFRDSQYFWFRTDRLFSFSAVTSYIEVCWNSYRDVVWMNKHKPRKTRKQRHIVPVFFNKSHITALPLSAPVGMSGETLYLTSCFLSDSCFFSANCPDLSCT